MGLRKAAQATGKGLHLINLSAPVQRVLRLTGLEVMLAGPLTEVQTQLVQAVRLATPE